MSKRHVKLLKKAKKYLWDGHGNYMDQDYKTKFICNAVSCATDTSIQTDRQFVMEVVRKISSYLNGYYTVTDYLENVHGIVSKNTRQIQEYRHAWLDQLIIEAEDW